jgi:hypothetical protein
MGDRTFAQFDLFLAQHVIKSMIFLAVIATFTPCYYFHHQTKTHHHLHHLHHIKLMISTRPPKKKVAHNFEVFSFKV